MDALTADGNAAETGGLPIRKSAAQQTFSSSKVKKGLHLLDEGVVFEFFEHEGLHPDGRQLAGDQLDRAFDDAFDRMEEVGRDIGRGRTAVAAHDDRMPGTGNPRQRLAVVLVEVIGVEVEVALGESEQKRRVVDITHVVDQHILGEIAHVQFRITVEIGHIAKNDPHEDIFGCKIHITEGTQMTDDLIDIEIAVSIETTEIRISHNNLIIWLSKQSTRNTEGASSAIAGSKRSSSESVPAQSVCAQTSRRSDRKMRGDTITLPQESKCYNVRNRLPAPVASNGSREIPSTAMQNGGSCQTSGKQYRHDRKGRETAVVSNG